MYQISDAYRAWRPQNQDRKTLTVLQSPCRCLCVCVCVYDPCFTLHSCFQAFSFNSILFFRFIFCFSVQPVCISVAFCSVLFLSSVVTMVTRAGLERLKLRLGGESSWQCGYIPVSFPLRSLSPMAFFLFDYMVSSLLAFNICSFNSLLLEIWKLCVYFLFSPPSFSVFFPSPFSY